MSQTQSDLIQKMAKENPVQKLQNMSDAELLSYWNQAKAQGYSLNQLKTLARAQGANSSDIAQFEKRIKNLEEPKETTESALVEDNLTSIFGISDQLIKVYKMKMSQPMFYQYLVWIFLSPILQILALLLS